MKNVLVLILSCFLIITTWSVIGPEHSNLLARGEKLVTGGQKAELGEIPYQVFLRNDDGDFCGGIILAKDIVLTAAHCVDDVTGDIEVVAGTLDLQTPEGNPLSEVPQIRRVDSYDIHPDYKRFRKFPVNDVAIVRVREPFDFNKYVRKINLPDEYAPYPVGKAKVSGWGPMEGQQLNIMDVQLLPRKDCANKLHKLTGKEDWNDKILCAEWGSQGRIETGDSGGALTKDGVVIGIVSAGDNSGLEFFTRVSQYVDWINSKIGHFKDEL